MQKPPRKAGFLLSVQKNSFDSIYHILTQRNMEMITLQKLSKKVNINVPVIKKIYFNLILSILSHSSTFFFSVFVTFPKHIAKSVYQFLIFFLNIILMQCQYD